MSLLTVVILIIMMMVLEALGFICFWKLYYEEVFYTQVVSENEDIGVDVPIATRDIAKGEDISDAITYKNVPSYMKVDNVVTENSGELKASIDIVANSIITTSNTYNPRMEDVVIDTSRRVVIDYLETPGVEEGDYIDIRLKVYDTENSDTYDDKIVASKKCVLSKEDDRTIELMLSESEILNMNSAVVDAASGSDSDRTAILYVTRYIDPANQPKASVTYNGKGRVYTDKEIAESQQRLKDMADGIGGYASPTIEEKAHDNSFGSGDTDNSVVEVEEGEEGET